MTVVNYISIALAVAIVGVVATGAITRLCNREDGTRGIGWQFIRYTVIGMALPLAGILVLNGALTDAVAAIIAGAMGYAFGQRE